ncbi:uncharacterized protein LOC131069331 [Cryptomeria japonica]|uniref:uncharacterized protein LOC131069331 n=1 Tax=Cryptomeria japonica TaxID=3369 RepID=UPI0027DA0794|nr:uncharacterized protein LOC131069331 [Cryptomeria japonica]
MMVPQMLSRLWSYFVFVSSKKARLTGQSPDGRETALLNYVLNKAEEGNSGAVLAAIDDYTQSVWMMNIGKQKGSILESAVQRCEPKLALELGTYCGYSAIRVASKMTKPGSKLISIEMNPNNCNVAKAMINHAGVASEVEVMEGTLSDKVEDLCEILDDEGVPHFDFILMDHSKQSYLSDFLVLKERGMIGKGTVIVSNNVGSDFSNYLQSKSNELESEEHKCSAEYLSLLPSVITVSTFKADLPISIRT